MENSFRVIGGLSDCLVLELFGGFRVIGGLSHIVNLGISRGGARLLKEIMNNEKRKMGIEKDRIYGYKLHGPNCLSINAMGI